MIEVQEIWQREPWICPVCGLPIAGNQGHIHLTKDWEAALQSLHGLCFAADDGTSEDAYQGI